MAKAKTYTVKEAALEVGVDENTLRKWILKHDINLQHDATDKRYITHTDLARLAQLYHRTLASQPTRGPLLQAILTRLETLEAAHVALQEEHETLKQEHAATQAELAKMKESPFARLSSLASGYTPSSSTYERDASAALSPLGHEPRRREPRERHDPVTVSVDLVAGTVLARAFAEAHGMSMGTAFDHIEQGKLEDTQVEIPNRPGEVRHYFSPEQQHAAIIFWRSTGNRRFHECAQCPHLPATKRDDFADLDRELADEKI
jgi:transposase-like protein